MDKSQQLKTLTEGIEAMAAQYLNNVDDHDKGHFSILQSHVLAQCIMDDIKDSIFAHMVHHNPKDLADIKDKLQDLIAFLIIVKASVDKL